MPEDRFGDLGRREGPGEPERRDDPRPASERLAELDEREPERRAAGSGAGEGTGARPSGAARGGRYMAVVGVVFVALVLYAAFDSARHRTGEENLLRGLAVGSRLPAFAAPLATGGLEGDANVKQTPGPDNAAGARPACQVRSPRVVNVCDLRRRPLALTFVVTRGADCAPALSLVDRVRRDFPTVNFAAVVSGSQRADVAKLVRARRIGMPVAVDRDGAVVNSYRVGVCPTTVFAAPGGKVLDTKLGELDESTLRRNLRALVERAR